MYEVKPAAYIAGKVNKVKMLVAIANAANE